MSMMENDVWKLGIVEAIEPMGEGSRVCIDAADVLSPAEGLLVGDTGHGYIYTLSENRTTSTYPARVFRINAGAVHQYIFEEGKTRYLAEIEQDEPVTVYEATASRQVPVGRVKIEKRELVRVKVRARDVNLSATLQWADSVYLMTDQYEPMALKDCRPGDRIYCRTDEPGRHLGQAVQEEIEER